MADNVGTVTGIYEAFGRGDIPAILDQLADDVEWERGGVDHGVPWLEPGQGKDHVVGFFGRVADNLEFERFQPTGFAEGDGVVVAFIELEATVRPTGKRYAEAPELHVWWFDEAGKVIAFRHSVDTARHVQAFSD